MEDVNKDIIEAERCVILKINQLHPHSSLAVSTIDVCSLASQTYIELQLDWVRGTYLRSSYPVQLKFDVIRLASETILRCVHASTTGLEAHSHCDKIVKEAGVSIFTLSAGLDRVNGCVFVYVHTS